jgi:hypothetical protein
MRALRPVLRAFLRPFGELVIIGRKLQSGELGLWVILHLVRDRSQLFGAAPPVLGMVKCSSHHALPQPACRELGFRSDAPTADIGQVKAQGYRVARRERPALRFELHAVCAPPREIWFALPTAPGLPSPSGDRSCRGAGMATLHEFGISCPRAQWQALCSKGDRLHIRGRGPASGQVFANVLGGAVAFRRMSDCEAGIVGERTIIGRYS